VVGIAGSVGDKRQFHPSFVMIRRLLADECARVPAEELEGMRIRGVDFFFERFKVWGHVLTQRYTIVRFEIELSEFLKGLMETDALQSTLTKGRSNESVYYYVHWAKLQAYLESDTDEYAKLVEESSRVGVARAQRHQYLIRIRSLSRATERSREEQELLKDSERETVLEMREEENHTEIIIFLVRHHCNNHS